MTTDVVIAPRTPPGRRPATRLLLVLAFLALVGGGLAGFHSFKAGILRKVTAQISSTMPTVSTAVATSKRWQATLSANGSLRASRGADLSSEVAGILSELHFESGDQVSAGALLARLRPDDDDAKVAQLQATVDLDALQYQRDVRQLKAQGVAQSAVDTDAGTLRAAQAQLAAQQAVAAEKFVRAPFAGRLGLRLADIGQYLSPGTKIVTLQALEPMFLDFYVPQQAVAQVRVGQDAAVHVDAFPGRDFPGRIAAINPEADPSSRMVQVRAALDNPGQSLLPGMFATVAVTIREAEPYVTVPSTAIGANPFGDVAYVVRHDPTAADPKRAQVVRQVFVTTGDARDGEVQVLKGVAAGDVVVTSGQIKLQDAAAVVIGDAVQPSGGADPRSADR